MRIHLLTPSRSFSKATLLKVQNFCRHHGWSLDEGDKLYDPHFLYAQSHKVRLERLWKALNLSEKLFLWALNGGYGTTALLPDLYDAPRPSTEKPLMGFSDLTALLTFVSECWGWHPFHGPMMSQLVDPDQNPRNLKAIEKSVDHRYTTSLHLVPMNGAAQCLEFQEAPIKGGNLSLLQRSLGTFWQIQPAGCWVFLEDYDAPPYLIAEMLTHLFQAGVFQNIYGLIFFDMTFKNQSHGQDTLLQNVLNAFSETVGFPVFKGTGVGHGPLNLPLQIGKKAWVKKSSVGFLLEQTLSLNPDTKASS